MAKKSENNYL